MSAHVVGRQTLEVETDSEALALALHARLSDLNRRRLLPALEAVFDELDRPGEHVRVERLVVDLGELPAAAFEAQVVPRLQDALREALQEALREGGLGGDSHATRRSPEAARRELLEHYLVHGTLPFWAPREPPFTCEAAVLDMVASDPAGLLALLRRLGHAPRVFERLALQLSERALRRLLAVLEPRHASLIVAYLASLRAVQSAERLLPLVEPGFSRLVWCLAQTYLVRDPGSQFNRRSFLGALVRGLAAREGFEYAELLLALQRALEHSRRRLARHVSFPSVVAELVRELDEAGQAPTASVSVDPPDDETPTLDELRRVAGRYADVERLRAWLDRGQVSWRELLRAPENLHEPPLDVLPELPGNVVRGLLGDSPRERRRRLARAVAALPEARVRAWLQRLLPQLRQQQSPLAEALATFAARARDRVAFHVEALAAALEGAELDLEAWAAAELPSDARAAHEPDELPDGTALLQALAQGLIGAGPAERDAVARRLEALATGDRGQARAFLLALGSAPRAREVLARAVPMSSLGALLAAALPPNARPLAALASALARLPAPRRPRAEDAWHALVAAAARTGGSAPAPDFYRRALRDVFAGGLTRAASAALLAALDAGAAPADELAALREALGAESSEDVVRISRETPRTLESAPATDELLPLEAQVIAWLSATQPPPTESDDVLAHALRDLLDAAPQRLLPVVRREVRERRRREEWAARLSEDALVRLVALLEPRRHEPLVAAMEILADAWSEVAPPHHPALFGRPALWAFLLEFLAETPAAERSQGRLADAFCAHFAARYAAAAPSASDGQELGARLLERAARLARGAGAAPLVAVLERERDTLLARFTGRLSPARPPHAARAARPRPSSSSEPKPPRTRAAFGQDDGAASASQPIYVANAGLVLVGAFLPQFFQALDLLGRDDEGRVRMRDAEALSRAVHLLQCLVDGTTATPEAALALNKVLCGVSPADPVAGAIEATDAEREAVERLLKSVLGNWSVLQGTSIAGLRETFLQREGRLETSADGYRLTVQRKTLDVLVDQLPWSYSVLLHGWMRQPLYTRW